VQLSQRVGDASKDQSRVLIERLRIHDRNAVPAACHSG
jgi:hypothetical protein